MKRKRLTFYTIKGASFQRRKKHLARGMTLVEVLLALIIGVLIITLAFSFFNSSTNTLRKQKQRLKAQDSIHAAVAQLSRDIFSALPGEWYEDCTLALLPDDNKNLSESASILTLCAPIRNESRPAPIWAEVHHITYRIEEQGDLFYLARISSPSYGPGSAEGPITNLLVKNVTKFSVTCRADEDWETAWPQGEKSPLPKTARIKITALQDGKEESVETETLVLAGHRVRSTLERAAAGAPAGNTESPAVPSTENPNSTPSPTPASTPSPSQSLGPGPGPAP